MGVRSEVGFIPALDGMRGIAVLWVALFHFAALRGDALDPWVEALRAAPWVAAVIRNGYLGVDLFFLISGFLLVMPWFLHERSGEPAPSARAFYARRIRRIVPAYYVQLAVLFAVVLPVLLGGLAYWKRDMYVFAANGIAHAAFLHNTSPLTSASMSANGALWTLAVEAQYYLLLPLLAPLFVRRPLATTLAAFTIAALWQHAARHGFQEFVDWQIELGAHWAWTEANARQVLLIQLPDYLGHFALGTLLGGAWLRWRRRGAPSFPLLAPMAAGALALLLWHLCGSAALWGEQSWLLTTLCLGILLFCAAVSGGRWTGVLLARGPLAFLGRISYSAYLYHLPVLMILLHFPDALPPALVFPAYALATVGIAWLSWRFIEQPFRK